MKIKALSLWEPWATLMRLGAKTVETRSWPTSYRGPLLICAASKRVSRYLWNHLPEEVGYALGTFAFTRIHERLYYGQAVAIVDLVDCQKTWTRIATTSLAARGVSGPGEQERAFGDFSPGRFAWITDNLRRIEPFPVRGRQGLFEVELPEGVLLL